MLEKPKYVRLVQDVIGPEINDGNNRVTVKEGSVAVMVDDYVYEGIPPVRLLGLIDSLNRRYDILGTDAVEITEREYFIERLSRG